jgi:NAD+ synthase
VNVGEAANNLSMQGVEQFESVEGLKLTPEKIDFNKGNIKARLRMVAQYQVASMYSALVIGTDHNSEAAAGFFTKFGDGACDLTVLNGLNKTQVRLVAKELGAPEVLWNKAPTADLEELNPGKLDDEGFGFPYWKLDLFLEGKEIDDETEMKIMKQFMITQHKRDSIVGFQD